MGFLSKAGHYRKITHQKTELLHRYLPIPSEWLTPEPPTPSNPILWGDPELSSSLWWGVFLQTNGTETTDLPSQQSPPLLPEHRDGREIRSPNFFQSKIDPIQEFDGIIYGKIGACSETSPRPLPQNPPCSPSYCSISPLTAAKREP